MFEHVRRWVWFCGASLLLLVAVPRFVRAQPADEAAGVDEDDAREALAARRFLVVLEKNPRRGTALDRVVAFHVGRGSLEEIVKRYRDVAGNEKPAAAESLVDAGTAWMIVGLLETQRGREGGAAEAFRAAEKLRAKDALPPFYLGQALVAIGQLDEAAAAFERALERQPPPADVLEILQALGRVHQRAQRPEAALAAWNRLEKLFPGDLRVQQQIAEALVDDGEWAAALPRYETLAARSPDRFQQSQFRLAAAELKQRLNRDAEARADLEQLVGQLNADSWLFREARRRIEEPFARTDDFAGLVKYYEQWLAAHPDDLDAMARLARGLARQPRQSTGDSSTNHRRCYWAVPDDLRRRIQSPRILVIREVWQRSVV